MDPHDDKTKKPVMTNAQFSEVFQQYWRKGGRPSRQEREGLCSFESDMETKKQKKRSEIQRLDEEMKRLNTQRSTLLQECNDDDELIRESQSLRPAIRSLPTEVLCRIFRFYFPVSAGHDMETSAHAAPVILGQVCKYWQDVAWSDRSLWSRLRIDLGSDRRPQLEWAIDAHVDRASTEVLAINVASHFNPTKPQWLSWTGKILGLISRCRDLWVSCGGRHLDWLGGLNPGVFHGLESMHFRSQSGNSSGGLDFSTALHLRSAHLEVALPEEQFWFTFSPTTLQDLTCILSRFASTDPSRPINLWRSFVQQYRDLHSVRVRFLGGGFDETVLTTRSITSFATPVTFIRARALSISIDSQADISAILLNFDFPSLDNLEVVAMIKTTKATPLNLLNTPAFNPNLTTLRLIRFDIKSIELYSLLRSTTKLTTLDIMSGRLGRGPILCRREHHPLCEVGGLPIQLECVSTRFLPTIPEVRGWG